MKSVAVISPGLVPALTQGESAAHRALKRLARGWARGQRLALAAEEVRLPRSGYRADVAAATPHCLAPAALTAVFECKVSRADFRRDSARETGAEAHLAALAERLRALRELIAGHRPDLRRGETLFAECDAYDLRGLRHDTHDRLAAELQAAQRRWQEGTKLAKLGRWRAASLLYVVAEEGILAPHEVPDGWGLLIRRGDALVTVTLPCRNETTPEERVALLERIAAAAGRERIRSADSFEPEPEFSANDADQCGSRRE
ncbi:hypothetical protein Verru16b_03038 [Lacunisphaera limnophila]|uniref:Uncharacterized protein n=1 Tax=Lacunisphaera limnophila TaxID=1838286 RepID=A0A1D8AYJ4_9BACT|nr:hypothetical protein [Lacunisphaera limnophila]AOS45947.1 hypothetical protein Verru16b_03038 [Lacunisphaera limnophila]